MPFAHAPRAVVFALDDLPPEDRRHIMAVAQHLELPQDPSSWRTPLVLTNEDSAPLAPGLSSDVELAGSGPSLLLLAMRLLLADAWCWPEQGFIGEGAAGEVAGYALYAADPTRWTADSLTRELLERSHVEVRRGLLPRGDRPWTPGGRVPVLGWQVPMLGRRDPISQLCDTRPAEERHHRFGGLSLPLGFIPGHQTDRHRLFLRVVDAHRDGDHGEATVELLRVDGARGELDGERLRLRLGELGAACEAGDDGEALGELLRELLPGSFYCCPQGGLLMLDLHRVELSLLGREGGVLGPIRAVALPPRQWLPEDEGAAPLDPGLWEAPTLAALLHAEECRLSPGGRLAALRFAGRKDGLPVDEWLVLDTRADGGARACAWQGELAGPAPALALSDDEQLVALHGAGSLSAACLSEDCPEGEEGAAEWLAAHHDHLLVLGVRSSAAPPSVVAALPLPQPLRGPASPTLAFLPGGRGLLCHQASTQTIGILDLHHGARPGFRPARSADLELLLSERGECWERVLRALATGDRTLEEAPGLGWLAPLAAAALPAGAAAELLSRTPAEAARGLCRRLSAGVLRTCDGDETRPIGE